MWLNPRFEVKVIQFVYDQLIEQRHEAGDMYRTLSNAAKQLKGVDYKRIGKGLNYIVFGHHESGVFKAKGNTGRIKRPFRCSEKVSICN